MTSPALWTDLHSVTRLPAEQQVLLGFLAQCKCESTLRAYRSDLAAYLAWLEERHVPLLAVSATTLNLYLRWMQEQRRWAEATVARRIGTVCSMYSYAAEEGRMPTDIGTTRKVRRPHVDHRKQITPFLLPVDFAILAKHVRMHGSVMEQAYFALCGMRGMRVGSACSLNVANYGLHGGYRTLTFVKKGGDLQTLQVPPPLMAPIEAAIAGRAEDEPLLLNHAGNRMTRANATRIVRRLCRAAGVDDAVASHGLRRSFTTAGVAAGVPLEALAETLGHVSTNTTRRHYDKFQGSIFRDRSGEIVAWISNLAS